MIITFHGARLKLEGRMSVPECFIPNHPREAQNRESQFQEEIRFAQEKLDARLPSAE